MELSTTILYIGNIVEERWTKRKIGKSHLG